MLLFALAVFCNAAPPVAKKVPHDQTINGTVLHDDYFWLRDKGTPEVEAYLNAETAYADAMMAPTAPLQKTLYDELLSRVQEDDDSAPYLQNGFYYYSRTVKGKQYPILCRKKGSLKAAEEIMLDENAMAADKKFFAVGGWHVSDDGSKLAYSLDDLGFRQYDLHVRDLASGKDGPEKIARVDSFAWAEDNKTLWYTTEDAVTKRDDHLFRHTLGQTNDLALYEEKDALYDIYLQRSGARHFVFVTSRSKTTSEVRVLSAKDPLAALRVLELRKKGVEYYAEDGGDVLYFRSNADGHNFALYSAPIATPDKAHWKTLIAHSEDVLIDDIDSFSTFVALYERQGGLPQIVFVDRQGGHARAVKFADAVYAVTPVNNSQWNATSYRVRYASPVTPTRWIDIDNQTLALTTVKATPVPHYDPNQYVVEALSATAKDGTRIPITLLHKKGAPKESPLLLGGYGSYGFALPDDFNANVFSLVDRGVAVALAHIRGGNEMGERWHEDGRMQHKMNTFTDFIAAAEFLIASGRTKASELAIAGRSAGGLLMGAVTNLRPDLFRAVIATVPFVDVMNTMLDETLPLTVGEFEEWGNPKKPEDFRYMLQYSPYDNLTAKAYPAMLVKSSYNDSQVMYWEPAKYVAKLRALKTDTHPLYFKIDMQPAGHGGASGRYDRLRENAFDDAFLLQQLGR